MKKIYSLFNCSTCKRILSTIKLSEYEVQNIKVDKITVSQIEELKKLAGSYEALFSRRAMKYKSMGLANKDLGEDDYKALILEEYTFLKRPVIIIGTKIFIGSSPKNLAQLAQAVKE